MTYLQRLPYLLLFAVIVNATQSFGHLIGLNDPATTAIFLGLIIIYGEILKQT